MNVLPLIAAAGFYYIYTQHRDQQNKLNSTIKNLKNELDSKVEELQNKMEEPEPPKPDPDKLLIENCHPTSVSMALKSIGNKSWNFKISVWFENKFKDRSCDFRNISIESFSVLGHECRCIFKTPNADMFVLAPGQKLEIVVCNKDGVELFSKQGRDAIRAEFDKLLKAKGQKNPNDNYVPRIECQADIAWEWYKKITDSSTSVPKQQDVKGTCRWSAVAGGFGKNFGELSF